MAFLESMAANREAVALFVAITVNLVLLILQLVRFLKSTPGSPVEKWKALMTFAKNLEIEAESMPGLSGAEKLAFVLSQLREKAKALGYPATDAEMKAAVEADVALSKQLNVPDEKDPLVK